MAVTNFTPLLGLALPTTGDLSGTWGTTVNTAITDLLDDAVAGTVTLSADADVTLTTTNGADNQARNAVILWTASNGATTRNVTAPAQSKAYIVINAGTGSVVIRGSGPTTGVTVASGYKALVAWNGSDFVKIASSLVNLTSDVTGTLPIANGGTGTTSTTFVNLATNVTGTLPVGNGGTGITSLGTGVATFLGTPSSANLAAAVTDETGSGSLVFATSPTLVTPALGTPSSVTLTSATGLPLTTGVTGILPVANGGTATATPSLVQGSGVTITGTWPNQTIAATGSGGTITAVSVVSANGLAGTSSGGTTPALTLSTSITGVLKGNGTAISAASAGTDYLAPPSGTAILKANSGGALANATAGTDYVAPGTATTFTATQTFSGTSSAQGIVLNDAAEVTTVSATAATGTIAYDITTQSVLYYTSNASANWTVNFRASSGTSLNTLMSTGQSMTVAFLVTQGATAYYNSAVQVDGTTSGVTTRWLGGAPTAGNASGIDSYRYLIIKTGSATFTVLASNTQFKA